MRKVCIIGAGLAGSEAAWQCARRGVPVELFEMRPARTTPAHQTAEFAELVCSNSLKSDSENTAPWLLKEEMRRAGSLLLAIARDTAVPAGHALAVDRAEFSKKVTAALTREALITVRRQEVTRIEDDPITVIATGPLTSDALSTEIARLGSEAAAQGVPQGLKPTASPADHGTAEQAAEKVESVTSAANAAEENTAVIAALKRCATPNQSFSAACEAVPFHNTCNATSEDCKLYFYDSISPIVEADSIEMNKVYRAARYDKGSADYINCPMTKEQYDAFYDALLAAQSVEEKDWERLNYFEGCLPIEEIARRGRDTLRFGPMKPVGLKDPRTGKLPYAVVQLRQENLRADSYNLVGFQNHLKYGEQARVLRLIPGLENARFLRYGQIHRNTYINAPTLLTPELQMKAHPNVLFGGQICGVEGYVESTATGLMAGIHAAALAIGAQPLPPPRATAFGSLVNYITQADPRNFQPANITFDLLPPLEAKMRDRQERHRRQCKRALGEFDAWLIGLGQIPAPVS